MASPAFLAKSLVIPAIYPKFKLKFVSGKLEFHIWLELPRNSILPLTNLSLNFGYMAGITDDLVNEVS